MQWFSFLKQNLWVVKVCRKFSNDLGIFSIYPWKDMKYPYWRALFQFIESKWYNWNLISNGMFDVLGD